MAWLPTGYPYQDGVDLVEAQTVNDIISKIEEHLNDTTNVHGITNTIDLVASPALASQVQTVVAAMFNGAHDGVEVNYNSSTKKLTIEVVTSGSAGPAGPMGATGPAGTPGAVGSRGWTGVQGATGATGVQGLVGATGNVGQTGPTGSTGPIGFSPGFTMSYVTATSGDPLTGGIGFNAAVTSTVTEVRVSSSSSAHIALVSMLTTLPKGTLTMHSQTNTSKYATFRVSAVTNSGNYLTLTVEKVSNGSAFSGGDSFVVMYYPDGVAGTPGGATGPTGPSGPEGPAGPAGGATGPTGPTGPAGATGIGIPSGGLTNQVLAKTSDTDYETDWVDQSGGGSGSGVLQVKTLFTQEFPDWSLAAVPGYISEGDLVASKSTGRIYRVTGGSFALESEPSDLTGALVEPEFIATSGSLYYNTNTAFAYNHTASQFLNSTRRPRPLYKVKQTGASAYQFEIFAYSTITLSGHIAGAQYAAEVQLVLLSDSNAFKPGYYFASNSVPDDITEVNGITLGHEGGNTLYYFDGTTVTRAFPYNASVFLLDDVGKVVVGPSYSAVFSGSLGTGTIGSRTLVSKTRTSDGFTLDTSTISPTTPVNLLTVIKNSLTSSASGVVPNIIPITAGSVLVPKSKFTPANYAVSADNPSVIDHLRQIDSMVGGSGGTVHVVAYTGLLDYVLSDFKMASDSVTPFTPGIKNLLRVAKPGPPASETLNLDIASGWTVMPELMADVYVTASINDLATLSIKYLAHTASSPTDYSYKTIANNEVVHFLVNGGGGGAVTLRLVGNV